MHCCFFRVMVIVCLLFIFVPCGAFAESVAEAVEAYDKGNELAEAGKYTEAVLAYGKALEKDPQYVKAYNNRGVSYKALGQNKMAIEDYSKAIGLNPQLPELYNNRGDAYDEIEDYQKALRDYNKAIELNPEYAKAYNNRGATYVKLSDYMQAIRDLNKAIELNPQYASAYNNRGTIHGRLKQYDQAIKDFSKAVELDPSMDVSYFLRGLIEGTRGNNNKADEDILKAARLGHQDAQEFWERRGVNWKESRLPEAVPIQTASAPKTPPPLRPALPAASVQDSTAEKKITVDSLDKISEISTLQDERDAVKALIDRWMQSWMSGDMETFRSCYDAGITFKNMNLEQWIARKVSIRNRSKDISIRLEDVRITTAGNSATASFLQYYKSSILQDKTFKNLKLEKKEGQWKILQENS